MTLFYRITKECTLEYLIAPINLARVKPYSSQNSKALEPINSCINRFASSFYPFCVNEWNNLDPSFRGLPSFIQFETALIGIITPPPQKKKMKSIYHLSDIPGNKLTTRLRLEFSELREDSFRHDFNCIEPIHPRRNDISCSLSFLSYPRNPTTLHKHSQCHCCDVMGFKRCLYSSL